MTCLKTDSTHWLRVSEFPSIFFFFLFCRSFTKLSVKKQGINRCHPCGWKAAPPLSASMLRAWSHMPFFHYSDQASCIVTTTNFLAVYKAVNQNHTEQGVGGGRGRGGVVQGRSWVGCSAPDQMSWKREGKGWKEEKRLLSAVTGKQSVLQTFLEARTQLILGCAE